PSAAHCGSNRRRCNRSHSPAFSRSASSLLLKDLVISIGAVSLEFSFQCIRNMVRKPPSTLKKRADGPIRFCGGWSQAVINQQRRIDLEEAILLRFDSEGESSTLLWYDPLNNHDFHQVCGMGQGIRNNGFCFLATRNEPEPVSLLRLDKSISFPNEPTGYRPPLFLSAEKVPKSEPVAHLLLPLDRRRRL